MASSHAVEWIDIRENSLCPACRNELTSNVRSQLPAS
jgi:predicted Zn-dependent protease